MKFMINELLYRRVWTVYDYRVNLSHVLFVMHQICLINRNLNKNIYFKQLKQFSFLPHFNPQERKLQLHPNRSCHRRSIIATRQNPTQRTFFQMLNNFEILSIEKGQCVTCSFYMNKISTKFAKNWQLINMIEASTLHMGMFRY